MKKLRKRKGDISIRGLSFYDGITFAASRLLDGRIQLKGPEVKAQQDYVGVINNLEAEEEKIAKCANKALNEKVAKRAFEIGLAAIILATVCSIHFWLLSAMFRWLFIISFGIVQAPSTISMYAMNHFARNEQIRSLARFHGAEHAVINAFYDLNRVPTLEEVRKYSIFSTRCGSLPEVSRMGCFILISMAAFVPSNMYFGVIFVLWVISYLLMKMNLLYFMEFLVVSQPTDHEYNIAISGISKALEELEKNGVPEVVGRGFIIAVKIEFNEPGDDNTNV